MVVLWVAVVALGVALGAVWRRAAKLKRRLGEADRAIAAQRTRGLRIEKRLARADALRCLERAGRAPALEMRFRSQFGEDVLMWELFERSLGGRCLEVGAHNGVDLAVTWAFEAMGWECLLIEALPESVASCRAHRPGSRVVHAALGASGGGVARFHRVVGRETHSFLEASDWQDKKVGSKRTEVVEAPLRTLTDVLEEVFDGGGRLDFAIVDVEGGEAAVFAGLDLSRLGPRALLVEDSTGGGAGSVRDVLTGGGYEHIGWLEENALYVRRDESALVERARVLLDAGRAAG
ncbi:MAG: FkbM family methyltransferase [Phycisphaerales bacterium]